VTSCSSGNIPDYDAEVQEEIVKRRRDFLRLTDDQAGVLHERLLKRDCALQEVVGPAWRATGSGHWLLAKIIARLAYIEWNRCRYSDVRVYGEKVPGTSTSSRASSTVARQGSARQCHRGQNRLG
jgi:hypothetical protein